MSKLEIGRAEFNDPHFRSARDDGRDDRDETGK